MKMIFQYLLLTAACAALGACQDFSDDTAFTPETPELSFVETSITAEKATKDYELSIKSTFRGASNATRTGCRSIRRTDRATPRSR